METATTAELKPRPSSLRAMLGPTARPARPGPLAGPEVGISELRRLQYRDVAKAGQVHARTHARTRAHTLTHMHNTCTRALTHTHTHAHTNAHTRAHKHKHKHTQSHTHRHTHTGTHTIARVYQRLTSV